MYVRLVRIWQTIALCILAFVIAVLVFGVIDARAQQGGSAPAQLKYTNRLIPLPFGDIKVVGLDDAGDLAMSNFVYRPGDKSIELFRAPDGSLANVLAMNSKGEIFGVLTKPSVRPDLVPAAQYKNATNRAFFVYDVRNKTYSPVNVFVGESHDIYANQMVAFNNQHQFVTQTGNYGTLPVGPPGTTSPPKEGGQGGQFTCPDRGNTLANSINDSGQISGVCQYTHSPQHASFEGFVYSIATGKVSLIRFSPGPPAITGAAINDSGLIAVLASGGAYLYDGRSFLPIPFRGAGLGRHIAFGNHGDLVGLSQPPYVSISSPTDHTASQFVQALDKTNRSFLSAASDRARKRRDAESSSLELMKKTGILDPNFPHPMGVINLFGDEQGKVINIGLNQFGSANTDPRHLEWRYSGSQPEIAYIGRAEYLGFDAEGSWFETENDHMPYIWNAKTQTIVSPLHPPAGPLKLPDPSEDQAAAEKQREEQAAKQPPPETAPVTPPGIPYAQNPLITREADGTYTLTYILRNFNGVDATPMKFKVARPAPKAPNPGLPPPTIGPGNNGSWIWIGEGAQQSMAALFNLDPSGKLTWMFLPPQVAASYLPKH
jgi:hypothetical protein